MAVRKRNTKRNYNRQERVSIKDLKLDTFIKGAEPAFSVLAGLLAGVPIAIFIDKQMTAKKIFGLEGDKLKKWVKPGANFILGVAANRLAKDRRIKLAGTGLAANGGLIALRDLLGQKDLLKGLIEGDDEIGTYEVLSASAEDSEATPLDLPLLPIDETNPEASEIIESAASDDMEGLESIADTGETEPGISEDQTASETEPVYEPEDDEDEFEISEIP